MVPKFAIISHIPNVYCVMLNNVLQSSMDELATTLILV
jgi:hypothetical protein